MASVCPDCDNTASTVKAEFVKAFEPLGTPWKSALFSCPRCGKVLNASFDMTSHAKYIIDQVTKNVTVNK